MPTDPRTLGAQHLDRVIEVSWQSHGGGGTFRSSVRGVLTHISHDLTGTSISVAVGTSKVIDIDFDTDDGDLELIGDLDPANR